MTRPSPDEVAELLRAWNHGDQSALEKLIPLVDDELRRLANAYLQREPPGHVLEPTALINEMLLRLIGGTQVDWESRRHFFAVAARRMRQILVDYAKAESARKHDADHVPLDIVANVPTREPEELLILHEALNKLAELDELKSYIVELKYFGGFTIKEIASVLHLSRTTVEREWLFARTWLKRELEREEPNKLPVTTIRRKSVVGVSLSGDSESKLAEAWANRELIATLMHENWAGLRLLVRIRLTPSTKTELSSTLELEPSLIDLMLGKLKGLGALETQDDLFTLTDRGHALLGNFEQAIGNKFDL